MLKYLINQIKEYRQLPIKYQRITGYVAVCGASLGSIFYCYYLEEFLLLFGLYGHIPLDHQVESGVMKLGAAALMLSAGMLCAYCGAVIVAFVFSFFMFVTGKFSYSEVIAYTFFSRYPVHWRIQSIPQQESRRHKR